jgi:hypothetical protein
MPTFEGWRWSLCLEFGTFKDLAIHELILSKFLRHSSFVLRHFLLAFLILKRAETIGLGAATPSLIAIARTTADFLNMNGDM